MGQIFSTYVDRATTSTYPDALQLLRPLPGGRLLETTACSDRQGRMLIAKALALASDITSASPDALLSFYNSLSTRIPGLPSGPPPASLSAPAPTVISILTSAVAALSRTLSVCPNCLTWSSVHTTSDGLFLTRPHATHTLPGRVARAPPLTQPYREWLAYQMVAALAQAHAVGVVHGAVRPSNFVVNAAGWLYLTDFAPHVPALVGEDSTVEFSFYFDVPATGACYLAPERVSTYETEVNLMQSDVFSLAVVVTELWMDRPLFPCIGDLIRFKGGDTRDVDSVVTTLPPTISSMVRLALSVDPAQRPAAIAVLGQFPRPFNWAHAQVLALMTAGPDEAAVSLAASASVVVARCQLGSPQPVAVHDSDEWDCGGGFTSIEDPTGRGAVSAYHLGLVTAFVTLVINIDLTCTTLSGHLACVQVLSAFITVLCDEQLITLILPYLLRVLSTSTSNNTNSDETSSQRFTAIVGLIHEIAQRLSYLQPPYDFVLTRIIMPSLLAVVRRPSSVGLVNMTILRSLPDLLIGTRRIIMNKTALAVHAPATPRSCGPLPPAPRPSLAIDIGTSEVAASVQRTVREVLRLAALQPAIRSQAVSVLCDMTPLIAGAFDITSFVLAPLRRLAAAPHNGDQGDANLQELYYERLPWFLSYAPGHVRAASTTATLIAGFYAANQSVVAAALRTTATLAPAMAVPQLVLAGRHAVARVPSPSGFVRAAALTAIGSILRVLGPTISMVHLSLPLSQIMDGEPSCLNEEGFLRSVRPPLAVAVWEGVRTAARARMKAPARRPPVPPAPPASRMDDLPRRANTLMEGRPRRFTSAGCRERLMSMALTGPPTPVPTPTPSPGPSMARKLTLSSGTVLEQSQMVDFMLSDGKIDSKGLRDLCDLNIFDYSSITVSHRQTTVASQRQTVSDGPLLTVGTPAMIAKNGFTTPVPPLPAELCNGRPIVIHKSQPPATEHRCLRVNGVKSSTEIVDSFVVDELLRQNLNVKWPRGTFDAAAITKLTHNVNDLVDAAAPAILAEAGHQLHLATVPSLSAAAQRALVSEKTLEEVKPRKLPISRLPHAFRMLTPSMASFSQDKPMALGGVAATIAHGGSRAAQNALRAQHTGAACRLCGMPTCDGTCAEQLPSGNFVDEAHVHNGSVVALRTTTVGDLQLSVSGGSDGIVAVYLRPQSTGMPARPRTLAFMPEPVTVMDVVNEFVLVGTPSGKITTFVITLSEPSTGSELPTIRLERRSIYDLNMSINSSSAKMPVSALLALDGGDNLPVYAAALGCTISICYNDEVFATATLPQPYGVITSLARPACEVETAPTHLVAGTALGVVTFIDFTVQLMVAAACVTTSTTLPTQHVVVSKRGLSSVREMNDSMDSTVIDFRNSFPNLAVCTLVADPLSDSGRPAYYAGIGSAVYRFALDRSGRIVTTDVFCPETHAGTDHAVPPLRNIPLLAPDAQLAPTQSATAPASMASIITVTSLWPSATAHVVIVGCSDGSTRIWNRVRPELSRPLQSHDTRMQLLHGTQPFSSLPCAPAGLEASYVVEKETELCRVIENDGVSPLAPFRRSSGFPSAVVGVSVDDTIAVAVGSSDGYISLWI